MRGWIVYDAEGAKRNEWFSDRLRECAEALSARAEIVPAERLTDFSGEMPDFAVVRTMNPSINAALERAGVTVFNNSATADIADDKYKTYVFASRLGIPTMPTCPADVFCKEVAYPVVAKSRDGHGGKEVFLIEDGEEFSAFAKSHDAARFIVQPSCTETGVDVRVYVLGGKVVAAVKRQSHVDFRSNYSLGGEISLFSPTEEQKTTAERIATALGSDFIGVDFISDRGKWVLNEIEDPVGTRALYALTDFDAAKEFMTYVVTKTATRVKKA